MVPPPSPQGQRLTSACGSGRHPRHDRRRGGPAVPSHAEPLCGQYRRRASPRRPPPLLPRRTALTTSAQAKPRHRQVLWIGTGVRRTPRTRRQVVTCKRHIEAACRRPGRLRRENPYPVASPILRLALTDRSANRVKICFLGLFGAALPLCFGEDTVGVYLLLKPIHEGPACRLGVVTRVNLGVETMGG